MDPNEQIALAIVTVLLLFPKSASASLKVGDRAPDFALPDQNGKIVKLSEFRGRKVVVLAFYLRASTPG